MFGFVQKNTKAFVYPHSFNKQQVKKGEISDQGVINLSGLKRLDRKELPPAE